MKRLTSTLILKRDLSHALKPRPFPGDSPTRIAWGVELKSGERHTYLGKPNAYWVRRFTKLFSLKGSIGGFAEFDTASTFLQFRGRQGDVISVNDVLWRLYHPWQIAAPTWPLQPFYMKKLGGFWVYSPYRVLKQEYIDAHKQWMAEDDKVKIKLPKSVSVPVNEPPLVYHRALGQPAPEERPWWAPPEAIVRPVILDPLDAQLAQAAEQRRLHLGLLQEELEAHEAPEEQPHDEADEEDVPF